jgi:hypothetical protein
VIPFPRIGHLSGSLSAHSLYLCFGVGFTEDTRQARERTESEGGVSPERAQCVPFSLTTYTVWPIWLVDHILGLVLHIHLDAIVECVGDVHRTMDTWRVCPSAICLLRAVSFTIISKRQDWHQQTHPQQ